MRRYVQDKLVRVRHARQRAVRGWDDTAIWALDSHLAKHLGEILVAMEAHNHHVFPKTGDYRRYGEALLAYADMEDLDTTREEFDAKAKAAGNALRWVGANLPRLWT